MVSTTPTKPLSLHLAKPLASLGRLARYWPVPCFFLLNSSLNMLNRWALGIAGFRFPLLLTCCHAAFGFMAVLPVVLALGLWNKYMLTLRRQWKGILVVGLCLAANIALNNISLVYISLSLNQIIRAAMPVATAIVAAALDRRLPRPLELGALLVLSTGVALAIAEAARLHGSLLGVAICVSSVFGGASMLVTSGRVMSERLDVMQLAFFTSPVTCLALLPLVAVRESDSFRQYLADHGAGARSTAGAIIFAGSVIAALYNMVHYAMVLTTSPVTTSVFGQAKIVGLLILSALVLGETKEFTLQMSIGCALALIGFSLYSFIRLRSRPAGAPHHQGASASAHHSKVTPAPSIAGAGGGLAGQATQQGAAGGEKAAPLAGAEGLGGTLKARAARKHGDGGGEEQGSGGSTPRAGASAGAALGGGAVPGAPASGWRKHAA